MEETNVSGEQIDYSRPWKPRMDQCEEATLLFGQAHLPLLTVRSTNRVIICLYAIRAAPSALPYVMYLPFGRSFDSTAQNFTRTRLNGRSLDNLLGTSNVNLARFIIYLDTDHDRQ